MKGKRNKWKIISIIVLALYFCLVFVDCAFRGFLVVYTPEYNIRLKGGTHYLQFKKPDGITDKSSDGSSCCLAFPTSIHFSSISEMAKDICYGKLTSNELLSLMQFPEYENGTLPMFDPFCLYDAELPDTASLNNISWSDGETYSYHWEDEQFRGTVRICTPEIYEDYFDKYYTNYIPEDQWILEEYIGPATNGTIITTASIKGNYKYIRYTMETAHQTLYVTEFYDLSRKLRYELSYTYVMGIDDGQPFVVYFYNKESDTNGETTAEERPQLEWVEQFGIRRFIG